MPGAGATQGAAKLGGLGGPIVGAVLAGFIVWLPSHKTGTFVGTAILMFVVLVGLRLLDPFLTPLWKVLDRVPRLLRMAAGTGLSLWYSISQFGPRAASHEVSTVRVTLVVTAVVAFVFFRPPARTPGPQRG